MGADGALAFATGAGADDDALFCRSRRPSTPDWARIQQKEANAVGHFLQDGSDAGRGDVDASERPVRRVVVNLEVALDVVELGQISALEVQRVLIMGNRGSVNWIGTPGRPKRRTWIVMRSARVKGSSVIRSRQWPGLMLSRSMDSREKTLPEVLIATKGVCSLKTWRRVLVSAGDAATAEEGAHLERDGVKELVVAVLEEVKLDQVAARELLASDRVGAVQPDELGVASSARGLLRLQVIGREVKPTGMMASSS